MNKIHAFGCSLTAIHRWRFLNTRPKSSPLDIRSYAISGGAHNMQFVRYGNGIYDGSISEDDIIIWQITDLGRHGVSVLENSLNDLKKKPFMKDKVWQVQRDGHDEPWLDEDDDIYIGNLRARNIYTNREMEMYTHHLLDEFYEGRDINEYMNIAEEITMHNRDNIYSLLLSISGIKRTNNKLLVVFGWDACLPFKDKMIDFFIKNDIDYITPSIFDWTIEQGYKQSSTNHPNKDGYKAFTNEILRPKLKSLDWI